MRAVDTNVLVRLITRDDPGQTAKAERFITPGAWVSLLALTEATWVLDAVYGREPGQIASAVEMLLDHTQLSLQDPDVVAASLDLFRRRPTLGFSDCLILEASRKARHLPLGTFDVALTKADGAVRVE